MKCVTCGKRIQRGEEVCSYCGAMASAQGEGAEVFSSTPATPAPKSKPLFPSEPAFPGPPPEADFPEMDEAELEEAPRGSQPPPPAPGKERPLPRPKVPALLRFLAPLLFLLIPLANFLFRDSALFPLPFQKPSLREAMVCENVRDGLPVNPRNAFSLSKDRQVVLYTLWRGRRSTYSYAAQWHSPKGRVEPPPETALRYGTGQRGFAAYGALPLDPGMEPGQWRVEIYLDDEALGSVSFELRE